MIIILSDNVRNKEASVFLEKESGETTFNYSQLNPSSYCNDKKIRVINIELPKNGPYFPSAISFANKLISCGINTSLETIEFFMPDFNYKLIEFAKATLNILNENGLKVSGKIITDINYNHTVLLPPSVTEDNKWEVYGVSQKIKSEQLPSLEELIENKEKELLFKGDTLEEWFDDDQRLIESSEVEYENLISKKLN